MFDINHMFDKNICLKPDLAAKRLLNCIRYFGVLSEGQIRAITGFLEEHLKSQLAQYLKYDRRPVSLFF